MFHHTGENAYSCPHCDCQFGRKNRLDSHIKAAHGDPGPVTCDICQNEFSTKAVLKKHLAEHNEKKRKPKLSGSPHALVPNLINSNIAEHHCPICAKTFSSKQSLQLHQKRAHNDITAEHKCKICDKTYGGMDAIMRHMSRMHKYGDPISFTAIELIHKHFCLFAGKQLRESLKRLERRKSLKSPEGRKPSSRWL